MFKNILLNELVVRGLEVKVSSEGYKVDGFYKSGSVTLIPVDPENPISPLTCVQRYDEKEEVKNFDDLVLINFKWWDRSTKRGWGSPDAFWLPHFERLNLVKVSTQTVVKAVNNG